jgi:hypothetical protein
VVNWQCELVWEWLNRPMQHYKKLLIFTASQLGRSLMCAYTASYDMCQRLLVLLLLLLRCCCWRARWSEQQWLQGWAVMAQRYAKNAAVVGMGLRNEPRPTFVSECVRAGAGHDC